MCQRNCGLYLMGRKRILNCRCGPNIVLYYDFFSFLSLKKPEALSKGSPLWEY
jgi:hypothetical protein